MKNICFYILQLLYGERVGFGQNTLGAVVLILSVYILEIYSVTARNNFYFNSLGTNILHGFKLGRGECRNQFIMLGVF